MLHIVEHMPEEFEGCQEISEVIESLAKKLMVMVDIDDFLIRSSKNMFLNAFPITAKLAKAGEYAAKKDMYRTGFYIGRAFDLLL